MSKEKTAPVATPIDTNGWDTIYAIYYPSVNEAIKIQKSSPASFTANDDDDGYTLAGTFGDWQLTTGGSGPDVNMIIPITSSTFKGMGKDKTFTPITLLIQLNLTWVSDPGAFNNALKVDKTLAKVSILNGTDWGDNVSQVYPDNKKVLTEAVKNNFIGMVQDWLADNVGSFQHTFAALDIDSDIANSGNKAWAWIKPTDKSYAVVEYETRNTNGDLTGYDINKSIFGVLCMTQGRTAPGVQQASINCIPDGVNSALVIRQDLLLANFFKPNMALMFASGATADDFDLDQLNHSISNNKTLTFLDQEMDGGKTVTPKVDSGNFKITFFDTYLELEFTDLYFDYSPGIHVHLTHTSHSNMSVNSKGQFKMDVNTQGGGFTTHASVVTDKSLAISQICMNIGLSIGGAIAGGFIGGALGSVGKVAAQTVGEAATATVEISAEAAAESAADATTNISTEVAGEAAGEATASVAGTAASTLGKIGSFFARQWPKILGQVLGGGLGAAIAEIPTIIETVANGQANDGLPTLDTLGTMALTPMQWPNLSSEGFQIVNGILNGALSIGINLQAVGATSQQAQMEAAYQEQY